MDALDTFISDFGDAIINDARRKMNSKHSDTTVYEFPDLIKSLKEHTIVIRDIDVETGEVNREYTVDVYKNYH